MLHHSVNLDVNADSTECCPVAPLRHLLAVGTYQLDEASQRRHGRLFLYSLQQGQQPHQSDPDMALGPLRRGDKAVEPSYTLLQQHTQEVPGILDMKWMGACSPAQTSLQAQKVAPEAILGVALADGGLRLYIPTNKPETNVSHCAHVNFSRSERKQAGAVQAAFHLPCICQVFFSIQLDRIDCFACIHCLTPLCLQVYTFLSFQHVCTPHLHPGRPAKQGGQVEPG